jgi:MFS transporter, DHA1 family, multidrug resistance protein
MNSIGWSDKQCLIKLFPLIITISFAMDVYVPAINEMGLFFHTSNAMIQASLYLFMITVAIGQLCIGPLADTLGRRKLAIYTAMLFLLGSLLAAVATSIKLLLIGRVIQALGACGTYLLCFIIVRDNFSTNACGRLFSLLNGINSIIASSAPIIGGFLLDATHNWRSEFYFLTLLGVLINLAVFKNIPDYSHSSATSKLNIRDTIKKILGDKHFIAYMLIASSCLLGLYLFCAISPVLLIAKLHISGTQYGLWFGLNAMTVFLANLMTAHLTKNYRLETIVNGGLSVIVLACLLMLACNWQQLRLLTFMIPMLFLSFGIGMGMGCATALALKDYESMAATATSIVSACQFSLAGITGALITLWPFSPMSLAIPVLIFTILGIVCKQLTNKSLNNQFDLFKA